MSSLPAYSWFGWLAGLNASTVKVCRLIIGGYFSPGILCSSITLSIDFGDSLDMSSMLGNAIWTYDNESTLEVFRKSFTPLCTLGVTASLAEILLSNCLCSLLTIDVWAFKCMMGLALVYMVWAASRYDLMGWASASSIPHSLCTLSIILVKVSLTILMYFCRSVLCLHYYTI